MDKKLTPKEQLAQAERQAAADRVPGPYEKGRPGWPAGEINSNQTIAPPGWADAPDEPPLTAAELRKLRRHMALWPA